MNSFFERYSALCKAAGETANSAARHIGASSGSVTAWKNGTMPRYSTLQKLADYFQVSVGYLSGSEDSPSPAERDPLEDADFAFYGEYKALSEDDKETVRDMVRLMRRRRAGK